MKKKNKYQMILKKLNRRTLKKMYKRRNESPCMTSPAFKVMLSQYAEQQGAEDLTERQRDNWYLDLINQLKKL